MKPVIKAVALAFNSSELDVALQAFHAIIGMMINGYEVEEEASLNINIDGISRTVHIAHVVTDADQRYSQVILQWTGNNTVVFYHIERGAMGDWAGRQESRTYDIDDVPHDQFVWA